MAGLRIVPKTAKVVIERTETLPAVQFDMVYELHDPIRLACELVRREPVKLILRHFAHNARDAMNRLWVSIDLDHGIRFWHGTGKSKQLVRQIAITEYTTQQLSAWPVVLKPVSALSKVKRKANQDIKTIAWQTYHGSLADALVYADIEDQRGITMYLTTLGPTRDRNLAYFKYVKTGVYEFSSSLPPK